MRYIGCFLIVITLFSCKKNQDFITTPGFAKDLVNVIPEGMYPSLKDIDFDQFELTIGDKISFISDSTLIEYIVLSYAQDDEGNWTGICPLNGNKLMGRQIPSGLAPTECLDLLDFIYFQKSSGLKYNIIDNYNIDINKVGMGSNTTVKNLVELNSYYQYQFKQRTKEQTPFNEGLISLNPVRECYFTLSSIIAE